MPHAVNPTALLQTRELPAIVVHGGAGLRPGAETEPMLEGVARAAAKGFAVLARGGSSVDAVAAAVADLEDDPHFNAGRGSVLTSDGLVELDASIMCGRTLGAGAVANVHHARNPVHLARLVMLDGDHVLMCGDGAERLGRELGAQFVDRAWFVTAEQQARFEELHRQAGARPDRRKLGTVGAVAVDLKGHVAAATSTGGTAYKRPGRVGDTPLIGCGTYADDRSAAVSCTGHGESIIRLTLAKWTCDAVARGLGPDVSAREATDHLRARLDGEGGVIVVAPDGRAGWSTNTHHMSRALMRGGMSAPYASL